MKYAAKQKRKSDTLKRKAKEVAEKGKYGETVATLELSSTENDSDHHQSTESNEEYLHRIAKRPKKLLGNTIACSQDASKTSNRKATAIPTIKQLGGNPAQFQVRYSSIRRERIKQRK